MKFMLAPLEDITGNALRNICYTCGTDLTFTPFSKIESLVRKNKVGWSRIEIKDDTPTVVQLLGAKEDHFKKFLELFKPSEGFNGFNLNIGCSSPNVINHGHGCAMIKRINKVSNIVKILQSLGYPVSVKLRLGLNEYEKQKKVYLNLINNVDADFFVVHARHGAQLYNSPADFIVYPECVDTGKMIVANGDIKTKEDVKILKSVGVKGVMIGRAMITNPCIFNELKGLPVSKFGFELFEKYGEKKYLKNFLKYYKK